ncbi:chaplin [Streptomyces sp. NBC_00654]|uniref:chaplin n=1 Tax=Streptomyces sp. NBC_00654 TaxID=2975799 RepID=UPI002B1E7CE1|nr:chaplin [Streptomyces sp. NBC_00654]
MRQVLNKSMIVMAAASGILTAAGGSAYADASAAGAAVGSPGVGSGNAVQVPVHIPVNACGNTVNVIALLNPAFGNACKNVDSGGHPGQQSGSSAQGVTAGSPGVLSGNLVQAPVDVPVNACGNSVNVVGLLNPAFGNQCANVSGPDHHEPPTEPPTEEPPTEEPPVEEPPTEEPPVNEPPVKEPPVNEPPVEEPPVDEPPVDTPRPVQPGSHLAETGAAGLGMAAGASAALLLGGAVLMRRTRGTRV